MKATSNRALLLLAAIACVPLACKDGGCGGSSNNATPTASVSAPVSASPIASTSSSGRARGSAVRAAGVTGSIFRAVNSLELKPEQKSAIDKIGADLIVMGTHGRRGISQLFLGSVAAHVVRSASVPVLTVGRPKHDARNA